MLLSEIESLCKETAHSTGLPVEWVRHHVNHRAGRPCARCGGSGIVGPGACFRCQGTGGKASHVGVADALEWVRSNVEHVRALGAKRAAKAPSVEAAKRHALVVAAETWKRDHADLWELLEGMLESDFRQSLIRAVEEGRVTQAQEDALRRMLVTKRKRDAVAPAVGSRVSVMAEVTSARHWIDFRGNRVFRVEFDTHEGWRARADVTSPRTVDQVQSRRSDTVKVRGVVVWKKDGFAILSEGTEILTGA